MASSRHVSRGALVSPPCSCSPVLPSQLTGSGFCLSLQAAPPGLQVAGQVLGSGLSVLEALTRLPCVEGGRPASAVLVCSATTVLHAGGGDGAVLALALSHEERAAQAARAASERAEAPVETRVRLASESAALRAAVSEAVEQGQQRAANSHRRAPAAGARGMLAAFSIPSDDSGGDEDEYK